ncbi:putative c6 finger domain-containing protein [Rosellinia necatrix]|uniref:Putative c6 finger domain-containing protein n=1 Tax=Rosellinia necatrix TaxID=77044 RepID=A0A1W2TJG3_ROSNE|nr:putative c6 finger domain-containing protein [Rosellinia necatrix]
MPGIDSMEHDIKPDIRDDSVLQQYPSPIAETQDPTSFYTAEPTDPEQRQRSIEQPSQSHEQPHERQHDHENGNQHAHHPGPGEEREYEQEPESSHPEAGHSTITSAEELRIAAQLSQDLSQDLSHVASILDEHNRHPNPNDDPSLRNGIARQGSRSPPLQLREQQQPQQQQQQPDEQLAHNLINHNDQHVPCVAQPEPTNEAPIDHSEGPLQHSHERSSQPSFVSDEQQTLHQQQQQQQHLIPDQQLSQPLPSQQPQPLQQQRPLLQPISVLDQLAQQYATHAHQTVQDSIPPRKRSKVSRACDECRRKKVKCDAASETGEEPCSNCRRSSIRCLFSRIPQKRGPSKGYIKELADRIHHIEGKLASEGSLDALTEILGNGRRGSSDIFSPSTEQEENSRKRPYSSISGADLSTLNPSRQGTWNSEPRPIQPYQTPTNGLKGTPYSANGLAPQPLPKPDVDTPSRTVASLDDIPIDLSHPAPQKELLTDAFGVYLSVVHPCFPFLASTKKRVEAQLSQCPSLLQDAFVEAFYGTMQSCVSAPGMYTTGDIGSATRIVAEWESDPSPRNSLGNVVHLQALILMAIATDNYGPLSLKGEHGGPSKASILGRAVGLAYSMRLHVASLATSPNAYQDGDSDESIAIRTWWSLVMLDRWNAISTASPLLIPNDSVVILPGLVSVLGENVYHLTRLSNILGHFAPVSLAPPQALSPDVGAVPILNSFFNLAIELFREVLPANITPSTHPILNLVYWHSRLLSYLFQTNARSKDVIWACKESVGLLLNNTGLLSPLNHHFFCLATLSLLELARLDKTREEVTPLLKDLLERNLAPSTWDGIIRDRITERLRPSTAQSATDQTLQHLAELATASGVDPARSDNGAGPVALRTSTTYADLGFDPRPILHTGYLNVLAGVSFASDPLG